MAWTHGIAIVATMAFILPAAAQDIDQRRQIEQLMGAYQAAYDKKDAAGVAECYTDDAVVLSPTTPVLKSGRQEIQSYVQKMIDHDYRIEGKVNSVTSLGDGTAIVVGDYHTTGKTSQGHDFDAIGYWSAVDVRNGDTWKIRMLTALPVPRE